MSVWTLLCLWTKFPLLPPPTCILISLLMIQKGICATMHGTRLSCTNLCSREQLLVSLGVKSGFKWDRTSAILLLVQVFSSRYRTCQWYQYKHHQNKNYRFWGCMGSFLFIQQVTEFRTDGPFRRHACVWCACLVAVRHLCHPRLYTCLHFSPKPPDWGDLDMVLYPFCHFLISFPNSREQVQMSEIWSMDLVSNLKPYWCWPQPAPHIGP